METKYITNLLWDKVEKSTTKIGRGVYNCMNRDTFSVLLDGDIFYFEKTASFMKIPNYVYEYAIRFYEKLGYKYLYEFSKGYTKQ